MPDVEVDGGPTPVRHTIPPGDTAAAALHLSRTVSRRAERDMVAMAEIEPVDPISGLRLRQLLADVEVQRHPVRADLNEVQA